MHVFVNQFHGVFKFYYSWWGPCLTFDSSPSQSPPSHHHYLITHFYWNRNRQLTKKSCLHVSANNSSVFKKTCKGQRRRLKTYIKQYKNLPNCIVVFISFQRLLLDKVFRLLTERTVRASRSVTRGSAWISLGMWGTGRVAQRCQPAAVQKRDLLHEV